MRRAIAFALVLAAFLLAVAIVGLARAAAPITVTLPSGIQVQATEVVYFPHVRHVVIIGEPHVFRGGFEQ